MSGCAAGEVESGYNRSRLPQLGHSSAYFEARATSVDHEIPRPVSLECRTHRKTRCRHRKFGTTRMIERLERIAMYLDGQVGQVYDKIALDCSVFLSELDR